MTNLNQFICTRPQLATILLDRGCKLSIAPNPWKPHLSAWLCDLDPKSATIISEFYKSIGQPVPGKVARYIEGVQS